MFLLCRICYNIGDPKCKKFLLLQTLCSPEFRYQTNSLNLTVTALMVRHFYAIDLVKLQSCIVVVFISDGQQNMLLGKAGKMKTNQMIRCSLLTDKVGSVLRAFK